ncbi:MAG TPA: hypothetical protein VE866_14460, partial [Candidatus Binatia bacterium]|nr:hypothetical protein [Candidatus Binatia bacterium]
MANISAGQVKELREKTGAPMMDCKQALTEAKGDMEQAVVVLPTTQDQRQRPLVRLVLNFFGHFSRLFGCSGLLARARPQHILHADV